MQTPKQHFQIADPDLPHETATSRGVLVVDGLPELIPLLAKKRFIVFPFTEGATEDEIGQLLAHRVLITGRLERFRENAAINEYSIIDIADYDHDAPSLAAEISRLWAVLGLKHKQGFVLRLHLDSQPDLDEIE
jgi:hypothetical protein